MSKSKLTRAERKKYRTMSHEELAKEIEAAGGGMSPRGYEIFNAAYKPRGWRVLVVRWRLRWVALKVMLLTRRSVPLHKRHTLEKRGSEDLYQDSQVRAGKLLAGYFWQRVLRPRPLAIGGIGAAAVVLLVLVV